MKKLRFTDVPRPALVSSLRHETLDATLADIEKSEQAGAQAFLLHAEILEKRFRDADKLAKVFAATEKPVMALDYRTPDCGDDNALGALLLECLGAGAAAVDMWLDMFDGDSKASLALTHEPFAAAGPNQVSMLPEAVEKQRAFIEKAHALGGEVLVSAHVGVPLNVEQGTSLARVAAARGADIVKIITVCGDYRGALETLETCARLHAELGKPFLFQCGGPFGAFVRLTAPLFGSGYCLCHAEYCATSNREKPLLADAKAVLDAIKWRL